MPMRNVYFKNTSAAPDYDALKSQLSSLHGVTEMDIDSATADVCVSFDDSYTSDAEIEQCISAIGYKRSHQPRHL